MASKARIIRPPGLVVFALFACVVASAWWLFADAAVERGVEATGESLVGARVELESADIRPTDGSVRLLGLQVANPDAPMSNLVEAEEITVDLLLEPLLQRKLVVENLVVTGVRFGTPRETSGALEDQDPETGRLWREVNGWADQIEVPSLSLESLTGTVSTEGLDADSLRAVQYARETRSRVDSMRAAWEAQLRALDPAPRIESARSVLERLEGFRPTPLNALQVPGLVRDGRSALESVTSLRGEVAALDDAVREGMSSFEIGPDVISELRAEDLAYARSLLNIPSLEAPSISPALFGGTALVWLKPVLFWARTVERFLPPGLDPRQRPGPQRARARGTTVEFPGRATYPGFLLQRGEIGLEIGGTGSAGGAYTANFTDLTSAPALLGRPMRIEVGRTGADRGPGDLSLSAVVDHTGEEVRDAAELAVSGVALPDIDLGTFGGRLSLGEGESTFSLTRVGDVIEARLRWTSADVGWVRTTENPQPASPPALGSAAWARELVWRTLTGVGAVELEMGLRGDIERPAVSITSNVGEAVAASLRRELGAQIADAEARLAQEVDSRIQPLVADARDRVNDANDEMATLVAAQRREVEDIRTRLDERLQELVGRGVGPNLVALPSEVELFFMRSTPRRDAPSVSPGDPRGPPPVTCIDD